MSEKLPRGYNWPSLLCKNLVTLAGVGEMKKTMKVTKASVKAKAMRKPAGKAPAMKSMKSVKAMKKPSAAMPAKKDDNRKKDDDYEREIMETDFARYYQGVLRDQRVAALARRTMTRVQMMTRRRTMALSGP